MEGILKLNRSAFLKRKSWEKIFYYTNEINDLSMICTKNALRGQASVNKYFLCRSKTINGGHLNKIKTMVRISKSLIATAGCDHTIRIWEIDRENCVCVLEGHNATVLALIKSQKGIIISLDDEMKIKVWDLYTRNCINTITFVEEKLEIMTKLSKYVIAFGSKDNRFIKIRSIIDNDKLITLAKHSQPVTCITKLRKHVIASGSYDNTIVIWNIKKGVQQILVNPTIHVTDIVKINENAIVSCSHHTIRLWSLINNKYECTRVMSGHSDQINRLVKLTDYTFASCCRDSYIKIWNVTTGLCSNSLKNEENKEVATMLKVNKTSLFFSSCERIKKWEVLQSVEQIIKGDLEKISVIRKLNCHTFAIGSKKGVIRILDINTFNIELLKGHLGKVKTLTKFKKNILLSSSSDRSIKMWNFISGECLDSYYSNSGIKDLVKLSKDKFAYSSKNNSISCFVVECGKMYKTTEEKYEYISSLTSISKDKLAFIGQDNFFMFLDTVNGKIVQLFNDYREMRSLRYIGNNFLAAVGTNSISLWDIKKRKLQKTLVTSLPIEKFTLLKKKSFIARFQKNNLTVLDFKGKEVKIETKINNENKRRNYFISGI